MSYIECKDVTLGYSDLTVLTDLSFSIDAGDYLCIVGENGAGKSTLVKTILGIVPPLAGEILFEDGMDKRSIGYLPQQTAVQRDFPASVREVVMSGFVGKMGFRPFFTKTEKEKCLVNMARMDIVDLKDRSYRELSGGQQQRVLLARALCATEKVLLLDEPVAGLDPRVTEEMYQLIAQLNKKDKVTIIMISHDIDQAVKYANKILHVSEKSYFGTKDDYIKSHYYMHLKEMREEEKA